MSRTERSTSRAAGMSAGRLLLVLTALAGLFAMHGVSNHDSTTMNSMTSVSMGSSMLAGDLAVGLGDVGDASAMVLLGADLPELGQTSGTALMWCLAIIAGLVVYLTRARGLRNGLLVRPATTVASTGLLGTARDPDAPDLFALCIQRC